VEYVAHINHGCQRPVYLVCPVHLGAMFREARYRTCGRLVDVASAVTADCDGLTDSAPVSVRGLRGIEGAFTSLARLSFPIRPKLRETGFGHKCWRERLLSPGMTLLDGVIRRTEASLALKCALRLNVGCERICVT
jgi:hypothetical protein